MSTQRAVPNRRSPAFSIIPDSQSPEPPPHQPPHVPASNPTAPLPGDDLFRKPRLPIRGRFPPPRLPTLVDKRSQRQSSSSSTTSVSSTRYGSVQSSPLPHTKAEDDEDVKPKLEDQKETQDQDAVGASAVSDSDVVPKRERSCAPEAEWDPEKEIKKEETPEAEVEGEEEKTPEVKMEPKGEEEAQSKETSPAGDEAELVSDRGRSRAPSHEIAPKPEEDDIAQGAVQQAAFPSSSSASSPSANVPAVEHEVALSGAGVEAQLADNCHDGEFGGGFEDDADLYGGQPPQEKTLFRQMMDESEQEDAEREARARARGTYSETPVAVFDELLEEAERPGKRERSVGTADLFGEASDEDEGQEEEDEGDREEDERVESVEGTPFEAASDDSDDYEDRPKKKRKTTAKKQPQRVVRKPTRSEEPGDHVDDFLADLGIEPKGPSTQSLVKYRLIQQLAAETERLPAVHAVQPVSRPRTPRKPSPDPAVEQRVKSPRGRGNEQQPLDQAEPSQPGGEDVAMEELEDFADEQEPPEVLLDDWEDRVESVEVEVLGAPPESSKRHRERSLLSWAGFLGKGAEPLESFGAAPAKPSKPSKSPKQPPRLHLYSLRQYIADCNTLLTLQPTLTPAALDLLKPSSNINFSEPFSSLNKTHPDLFISLLSSKPHRDTLADLWRDLLSASHEERHREGSCLCSSWTPASGRTWEEERQDLVEMGCEIEDLLKVLEEVFEGKERRLEKAAKEGGTRLPANGMEGLLELIFESNRLWFHQIVDFSSVSVFYSTLGDPVVVTALQDHITICDVRRSKDLARLQQDYEDARDAAESCFGAATGGGAVNELWQEVKTAKSAWKREREDLVALLYRLDPAAPAPAPSSTPAPTPMSKPVPRGRPIPPRPAPAPHPIGSSRPTFHPPTPAQPAQARPLQPQFLRGMSQTPSEQTERREKWRGQQPERYHWGYGGSRTPAG